MKVAVVDAGILWITTACELAGFTWRWIKLDHGISDWALNSASACALAELMVSRQAEIDMEGFDGSRPT